MSFLSETLGCRAFTHFHLLCLYYLGCLVPIRNNAINIFGDFFFYQFFFATKTYTISSDRYMEPTYQNKYIVFTIKFGRLTLYRKTDWQTGRRTGAWKLKDLYLWRHYVCHPFFLIKSGPIIMLKTRCNWEKKWWNLI